MENQPIMTPEQTRMLGQEVASAVIAALQKFNQNNDRGAVPNNQLMTRDEVCNYLKISHTTLWYVFKAKGVKPIKLGRRAYYRFEDIQELLTNGQVD